MLRISFLDGSKLITVMQLSMRTDSGASSGCSIYKGL